MSDKFCKDCRHFLQGYMMPSECRRPLSGRRSPVSGQLDDRLNKPCATERRDGRTLRGRQRCGPGAIHFEMRD
jgi:hypothetical protein